MSFVDDIIQVRDFQRN